MMSPKQSPSGIEVTRKVRVKRINRKALGLTLALLGVSVMLLLTALIEKKEKQSGESKKDEIASSQMATPPKSIETSSQASTQRTEIIAAASGSGDNLGQEQADFEREIRRDRQRAYLSKLALSDTALMSDVKVDKGVGDSGHDASSESALRSSSGQASADQPFREFIAAASGQGGTLGAEGDPNMQGRKEDFLSHERTSGYLPERKKAPLSPYEIKTGTVIPMVLVSGINSDLPGQIIAQVSETVYDTATGQYPLIPQGSKLIGKYDSFVALGQESALVVWNRLVFPDGSTLELLNMSGADKEGYAGFRDLVDNHYLKTFGNAILLSLVGSAYQISQPDLQKGDSVRNADIVASQVAQTLSQISGEQIRRNMQIQPNIKIRAGYEGHVMVNKDIILEPIEGI